MPQRTPAPNRPRNSHAHRVLALLLLIILAPILGCSAIVTDDQAPGTYKADTDWGVSTVVLSKDHTFHQTVTLKNGQTKQVYGHWKISRNTGDIAYTTISLSPFYSVTHDKQGDPTIASAYSIYHVPFGGINIAADPDHGIAFRK